LHTRVFQFKQVHLDTEKGNAGPSDPLAALEKLTDAQNHVTKVQIPRLESLQAVSEHYNSDPYSLSLKVRKRFRTEKKVEKEKKAVDDGIKDRYGLPETLSLLQEDDKARSEAIEEWQKGRRELEARETKKRRLEGTTTPTSSTAKFSHLRPMSKLSSGATSSRGSAISSLRARILENTARHSDPLSKERSKIPERIHSGVVVRK
jgi:coiled-coil domain-containing protein 130